MWYWIIPTLAWSWLQRLPSIHYYKESKEFELTEDNMWYGKTLGEVSHTNFGSVHCIYQIIMTKTSINTKERNI